MISPVKRRKHHVPNVNPSSQKISADEIDEVHNHLSLHNAAERSRISAKHLRFPAVLALATVMIMTIPRKTSGPDQQKILPLASLDRNSLLLGQYSLDDEYRYWPIEQQSSPKWKESSTVGMIYFPSVDLTTQLVEDANDMQLRSRLLGNTTELFSDISLTVHDLDDASLALLTLKGYKGATPNQDRSVIVKFNTTAVEPNESTKNHKIQPIIKEAILMGIFDGHGERGHEVSQHVALKLPAIFVQTMKEQQLSTNYISPRDSKYDDFIQKVLTSAYLRVDDTEPVKGSGASGGSTASTVFYPGTGSKLYLANVGDSTTIIAHYSKSSQIATIVKQNRKDKPHMQEEKNRIEAAGGQVYIPFHFPSTGYGPKESSRLLITLPGGHQLGLAMSRSIGDAEGKSFGLIAEPTVDIFDAHQYYIDQQFSKKQIEDSEWFVVIASDGIYDVLPPETVVQRLGQNLYGDGVLSAAKICEQLIREASRLWIKASMQQVYRDDITLGLSKIAIPH